MFEVADEGTDSVYASVNFTLAAGQSIEALSANAGAVGLTLTGNELANRIYGDPGDETLFGQGGNDRLEGGLGIDSLSGGQGSDRYIVDHADDTVWESAGQGTDIVYAEVDFVLGAGQSIERLYAYAGDKGLTLTGNELANSLYGAAGDDVIIGGEGRDQLTGDLGADRFVLRTLAETGRTAGTADRVLDFTAGTDQLDLSSLDAVSGGSDDAFSFIGTGSFSRTAGELRVATEGGWTRVMGDVNGDGLVDFMVLLLGVHSLSGSDFVL